MIAVAWRFTCCNVQCNGHRPLVLEVEGEKAEAVKAAREEGWRPCHEFLGGRRTLSEWYCPECALWWRQRRAQDSQTLARLGEALDQARVEVAGSSQRSGRK